MLSSLASRSSVGPGRPCDVRALVTSSLMAVGTLPACAHPVAAESSRITLKSEVHRSVRIIRIERLRAEFIVILLTASVS